MNTSSIPQGLTNIPFGQIFILTNPKVGITSKTIHMMGFILSMAKQYDQGHIVNSIPVDCSDLWNCFACKVKTEDGDQILVSDKDTLVEMLCEFWGLDYDEVCKTIVIPKRNKTVTFGGERHPVRVSLKPVGKPVPGMERKDGSIYLELLQDHSREKTLLDIRSTFKDNFNFGLGITLEEVLAIYKEEQALKKTYKLDIQVKWKDVKEYKHPKWVIHKKMTVCNIILIDNLGNSYPIKLETMAKAIYLTYLFFPEGIAYTQITYSDEFYNIFEKIYRKLPLVKSVPRKFNLEDKADLDTFTNYISRIRKAILAATKNDTYAQEQFAVEGWRKDNYRIAGATDEIKKKVKEEFRIK